MTLRTVSDPLGRIEVAEEPVPVPTLDVPTVTPDRDATLAELVHAGLVNGLARIATHEAVILDDRDPEGVHQARVGARRARSVLRVFRSLLDPDWVEELDVPLKALGQLLGRLRDTDVLTVRLHDAVATLPDHADQQAAAALEQRLADERREEYRQIVDELVSEHHQAVFAHLLRLAEEPRPAAAVDLRAPAAGAGSRLVIKPWRKLDEDARAARRGATDAELHRLRIRAKRARYAADAVAPVAGRRARELSDRLAHLQDDLGELHDLVVFEAWLREAAASVAVPRAAAFAAGQLVDGPRRAAAELRASWPARWKAARQAARHWPALS